MGELEVKDRMKPCPFCGSKDTHIAYTLATANGYCERCDAVGPLIVFLDEDNPSACEDGIKQAREAWNDRIN